MLNQRSTYWVRARPVNVSGVPGAWTAAIKFRTLDGDAQDLTVPNILAEPALVVLPEKPQSIFAGGALVAGHPLSNMFLDAPVAAHLKGDFASGEFSYGLYLDTGGVPIDTIAMLHTNLDEAARVTISAYNLPNFTEQTILLGNVPFRASANLPQRVGFNGLFRFTETPKRYISIEWRSKAPLTQVTHLVIGKSIVSKNVANEKTQVPQPLTSIERKRSGNPDRVRGFPMRKVDFDLVAIDQTKYETLYGQLDYREGQPVLVVPNSKPGPFLHDRILYGDLGGGRSVMQYSNLYRRSFSISSLI